MRVVVVGNDVRGRSHVSEVIERSGPTAAEAMHELFAGPLLRAAPPGDPDEFLDMSPGRGAATWRIFEFSPGLVYDMHHTDTVDFDVVVDGSMTLALDEEDIDLQPGDAALLQGHRHGWRAGPNGCRMLFALLGADSETVA